ncbi:ribonuclease H [Clostridium sp.]|uniref:ribonuclease H family protein n=1 Tax=Clostridium sp. TaxID=1506 RepID=UPI001A3C77FD|nr:ribonuclease H [Clostridium sp.]MBK5234094.1 ribonuclease HI [Clostridium sp.]
MKLKIYTDGSCSGNPGPGGWGCIIIYEDDQILKLSGGDIHTTNNRMELQAINEALIYCLYSKEDIEGITIYSDSNYCVNSITNWLKNWKRNGWVTKARAPIKNKDIFQSVDMVLNMIRVKMKVDFVLVKGHDGNMYNEMADVAAVEATQRMKR